VRLRAPALSCVT